ncbi:MAG TPA: hypothetical protein VKJ07_20735, partial [Mycobacteriales bacterium]|nr:hypothetical protein [Mycobacteriales bacterium]
PRTVTARYLRFTLVDTFCASYAPRTGCGSYFVLSDLRAGLLSGSVPRTASRLVCRRGRHRACRKKNRRRRPSTEHRRRRPPRR